MGRGSGLSIRCNWCLALLTEPGALIFSPPHDKVGTCTQLHLCVSCWQNLRATQKTSEQAR